jgi:metal transporter CNNM
MRSLESEPGIPTCVPEGSWVDSVPAAVLYIIIIVLVLFSAFFSGLTLALMSLDTSGLEIVMSGDDPNLARAAARIYPVRKNGNLLLCTLLLGNVAVNTLLGILMADLTSGTVGFISSTAIIVIFGEIIPQAVFSRYALQVGEKAVPVMKVIIVLFYVLAKPLAFLLDKLLGHELGTTYSQSEMSKLLEMHVKSGQLNLDQGKAMTGALQYQTMRVEEVMTPLEKTFMLNVEEKLNFETMATIFKTGFSRIPVYENNVANVIGLLFVKDLIFINPVDATPVRSFVDIFGRGAHVVWADDKLGEVLAFLKQGHCHMALVRVVNQGDGKGDPFYEIKGIITLEDIIEVILGDQILDETDAWEDADHTIQVKRAGGFDWARLRLLDANIVDQTLGEDEVRAVAAHLSSNYSSIFDYLSQKQLGRMIAATPVIELEENVKEVREFLPSSLMYEKGTPSDKCTLVLGGKVTVIAGQDNFRSDLSSWSLLAPGALNDQLYAPDFSAYVSKGPCRCLQFSREIFSAAVAASELEALPGYEENAEEQPPESLISEGASYTTSTRSTNAPSSLRNLVAPTNTSMHSEFSAAEGETMVEHRGKLLEKLLQDKSIHERLGDERLDDDDLSTDEVEDKEGEQLGDDLSLDKFEKIDHAQDCPKTS